MAPAKNMLRPLKRAAGTCRFLIPRRWKQTNCLRSSVAPVTSVSKKRCSCPGRAARITCATNPTVYLIARATTTMHGLVALPVTIHTTSWQTTQLSMTQNVWPVTLRLAVRQRLPHARLLPARSANNNAPLVTCQRSNCLEHTASSPIIGSASPDPTSRLLTDGRLTIPTLLVEDWRVL